MYSVLPSRENRSKVNGYSLLIISVTVLIATGFLFAIDKETHQFSDLLSSGNLVALVVYFIPTFLICLLMHHVLSMKMSNTKSMFLSLLLGVPVSFAGIIYMLS